MHRTHCAGTRRIELLLRGHAALRVAESLHPSAYYEWSYQVLAAHVNFMGITI